MFKKIIAPFLSHPAWAGFSVIVAIAFGVTPFFQKGEEKDDANITTLHSTNSNNIWVEPLTKAEFVWVTGGCFQMGKSKEEQSEIKKEIGKENYWLYSYGSEVRHKVCVDGFWMSKYEVTQGEWEQVMEAKYIPSKHFNGTPMPFDKLKAHIVKGKNYPVADIYFSDAQRYVDELNSKNNGAFTIRMPTEAEWEYSCRSGGKEERYAGSNDVESVGWYEKNSFAEINRVGLKSPNAFGIYDMSGNVEEWVIDTCDNDSYLKHSYKNPVRVTDGTCKGSRGGGWMSEKPQLRCTTRWGSDGGSPGIDSGFRLVRIPE